MESVASSAPTIVCFGDSLTAGYQSPAADCPGGRDTPYGEFLQHRLGAAAQVLVSGICGEVTGEMVLRFRRDVLDRRPAFVVLLGGTNDLGWHAAPADIMRNLLNMYEQALGAGIRPIAVTVPSIRMGTVHAGGPDFEWLHQHVVRRQGLNALIVDYCARRDVPCVDLFSATIEPETMQLAATYSNDGLHLTTDGYALLAELLYDQVFGPALGSGRASSA